MRPISLFKIGFYIVLITLLFTGFIAIPTTSPKNERVAVVFLKHSAPFCSTEEDCLPSFPQALQDAIQQPRHTATQYESILNGRMSAYFDEVTYNKVHITFDAIVNPESADGWFDAPHQLYEYNDFDTADWFDDALGLAYPIIGSNLENYDVLLVVQNIQVLFGKTTVYGGVQPGDFVSWPMSAGPLQLNLALVTVGENPDDGGFSAVVAHELGHVHSLYHSIMWRYDQMGGSDVVTHFSGWSKAFAGWLTGITDMPCIQGPCEISTQLTRLSYEGNNLLRIPFIESPFVGYTVECRAKVSFDANIPDAGVVINSVDTSSGYENAAKIVFPRGGDYYTDADYLDAALAPGEAFVDEVNEITIMYESKTGTNDCNVKATRGEITAPDPSMRGSISAAENSGNLGHDSYDIYIDSQKNGWDVYGSGNGYTNDGGQVAPTNNGDPFWVNHENRIRFKIRNDGYGPAENVKVNVFVKQPLTIFIPGITCEPKEKSNELVGSVVIDHLEANEIYFGYVPWTPKVNSTALVTVGIEDYIGEITHANNIAKETYPAILISGDILENTPEASSAVGSLVSSTNLETISVETEKTCITGIPFYLYPIEIKAIAKKDWVMQISQSQGIAQPNEGTEIGLMSIPPADAQAGDCGEAGVVLSSMPDDIFLPLETFVFRSCMVEVSEISCGSIIEPIEAGARATITGKMSHQVTNGIIALEYTSPGGDVVIENAPLDETGKYTHQFLPEKAGDWKVQAFWQGDDKTSASESEICTFSVKSGKPEFTLNHNINCRSGPGTEYPVITSGLIGDVVEIEGRSADALWLFGKMKNSSCWMSLELGNLNVHPWSLPEKQAPPKPIKPTTTTSVCATYTTEAVCNRHTTTCKWVTAVTGGGVCKAK